MEQTVDDDDDGEEEEVDKPESAEDVEREGRGQHSNKMKKISLISRYTDCCT